MSDYDENSRHEQQDIAKRSNLTPRSPTNQPSSSEQALRGETFKKTKSYFGGFVKYTKTSKPKPVTPSGSKRSRKQSKGRSSSDSTVASPEGRKQPRVDWDAAGEEEIEEGAEEQAEEEMEAINAKLDKILEWQKDAGAKLGIVMGVKEMVQRMETEGR